MPNNGYIDRSGHAHNNSYMNHSVHVRKNGCIDSTGYAHNGYVDPSVHAHNDGYIDPVFMPIMTAGPLFTCP